MWIASKPAVWVALLTASLVHGALAQMPAAGPSVRGGVAQTPSMPQPFVGVDSSVSSAIDVFREGERLLRGQGAEPDPAAACERFETAARERLPQAWLRLGQCHARGWGRSADPALAADWYRRAAETGLAAAQTAYALALQRGEGVGRDPVSAASWLGRAAGAGDSNAALALARAYEAGVGLDRDPVRAGQWMQRSADLRNPAAQLSLAQWYLNGQIVEASPLLAYAWAQVAAESALRVGDAAVADRLSQRAVSLRRQAAGRLSGEQLIEGQRMGRGWQPNAIALRLAQGSASSTSDSPEGLPPTGAAPAPVARSSAAPAGAPVTAPPVTAPSPASRPRSTTGSGFFVSRAGHLVTNEHVVRDCREVRLGDGQLTELIAVDRRADLALLKAGPVEITAVLRADARTRQGEDVVTYGFPLRGVLSSAGQVGAGMITALTGLRDNPLQIQIDVPVQPGNSGGPLIDAHGEVIGVVVSKLNALKVAQVTGDIPQNVNFAVAPGPLKALLEAHSVPLTRSARPAAPMARESIAEAARRYTAAVLCAR